MAETDVVIIGSSVGGVRTAKALRSKGFTGRIVLVGKEVDLPYDKPPLSKQFLAGVWNEDRLRLLSAHEAEMAGIELRLGTAADRLDVANRNVILSDRAPVHYDILVIATGAAARPSPWRAESGIHVLRTLEDSRKLAEDLANPGPVVVVGGGFIGAEVAATAHGKGREVTIVDPLFTPIGRVVGDELGPMFTGIHRHNGVRTCFGEGVESIDGQAGALRVALTNGEILPAATVVVGIGTAPNEGWLASSGLLLEDGVVCDQFCRALNHDAIFAVGDVARWHHPRHRENVRIEHWTNAADQALCVAHNITHPDDLRAYAPTEYVWSDQYDWKIQIVGRPNRAKLAHMAGDLDGEKPQAAAVFTDESGIVAAAVTVNWPKAILMCRQMISSQTATASAIEQLDRLPRIGAASAIRRAE
jgi:NADPH-dependent 2,4-dienoyl-CoA reductase/sulfur reductase-like enzyme